MTATFVHKSIVIYRRRLSPRTARAGIKEADDRQVTTVFTL